MMEEWEVITKVTFKRNSGIINKNIHDNNDGNNNNNDDSNVKKSNCVSSSSKTNSNNDQNEDLKKSKCKVNKKNVKSLSMDNIAIASGSNTNVADGCNNISSGSNSDLEINEGYKTQVENLKKKQKSVRKLKTEILELISVSPSNKKKKQQQQQQIPKITKAKLQINFDDDDYSLIDIVSEFDEFEYNIIQMSHSANNNDDSNINNINNTSDNVNNNNDNNSNDDNDKTHSERQTTDTTESKLSSGSSEDFFFDNDFFEKLEEHRNRRSRVEGDWEYVLHKDFKIYDNDVQAYKDSSLLASDWPSNTGKLEAAERRLLARAKTPYEQYQLFLYDPNEKILEDENSKGYKRKQKSTFFISTTGDYESFTTLDKEPKFFFGGGGSADSINQLVSEQRKKENKGNRCDNNLYKLTINDKQNEKDNPLYAGLFSSPISMNVIAVGNPLATKKIVLVHGYGAGAVYWFDTLKALADTNEYMVYAIDLIGFGRSSRPKFPYNNNPVSQASLAKSFFVESLELFRIEKKLQSFILVGHSLGGYISGFYTATYPDRVSHLILVSPAGMQGKPDDVQFREMISKAPTLLKIARCAISMNLTPFALVRASGPQGPKLVRNYVQSRYSNLPKDLQYDLTKYLYHCSAKSGSGEYALRALFLHGIYSVYGIIPLSPSLEKLNVKMSFVYGVADFMDVNEANILQETMNRKPGVHVIGQAGHQIFLDNPTDFNTLLLKLIAET